MSWEQVGKLGGILYCLTMLFAIMWVVAIILRDKVYDYRQRRADDKILKTATDGRKDFDTQSTPTMIERTPYLRKVYNDLPEQRQSG